MSDNWDAWEVFLKILPQARTAGLGGFISVDLVALPAILECLDIPRSEWGIILDKVGIATSVFISYLPEPAEKE